MRGGAVRGGPRRRGVRRPISMSLPRRRTPALPCPALPCPALPCPALLSPALPCLMLSFPPARRAGREGRGSEFKSNLTQHQYDSREGGNDAPVSCMQAHRFHDILVHQLLDRRTLLYSTK